MKIKKKDNSLYGAIFMPAESEVGGVRN